MEHIVKYAVIMQRICEKVEPGKKMLQKLMYLMERKNVDLELNYTIHFFGPYSSKLDHAMHVLESQDMIRIDTSGMKHIIKKGDIEASDQLTPGEQENVDFVLGHFLGKSALELEAITTLDYAAVSLLGGKASDKDIIKQVKDIKGTKFTDEYLAKELKVLKKYKFLC